MVSMSSSRSNPGISQPEINESPHLKAVAAGLEEMRPGGGGGIGPGRVLRQGKFGSGVGRDGGLEENKFPGNL
jgi:hypothetical protein